MERNRAIIQLRILLERVVQIGAVDAKRLPANLREERKRIFEVGSENGKGYLMHLSSSVHPSFLERYIYI